jgi:integrase
MLCNHYRILHQHLDDGLTIAPLKPIARHCVLSEIFWSVIQKKLHGVNLVNAKAGIEDFRFHDLRHTWASWLIQSGVPLSVLQEMGGWESFEMVRRYAHLAPNHLSEHARKIDAIFGNHDTNTTQGENQAGLKLA